MFLIEMYVLGRVGFEDRAMSVSTHLPIASETGVELTLS
jgi:hypothetical protein